jgi:hypothetical protein
LSEGYKLNDVLKLEAEGLHSRDQIVVLAGQSLSVGSVLGKVTAGAVPTTGTAGAGNTGNGTCTGVVGASKTKPGTYVLRCIVAIANSGVFNVIDPEGNTLPIVTVGVAYPIVAAENDQISFTINDGSADFIVGDVFTILVPVGGGQCRAINFSGVDGSQKAIGLSYAVYNAAASGERTRTYTSGGTYVVIPGDTITGATSGATARVVKVTIATGAWATGDAAGTLTLDDQVGTFQSENLNIAGNLNVATIAGDSSAVAASDIGGVAIVRDAEIVASRMVWPSGATAAQKAVAVIQLAALGIIIRTEG